MNNEQMIGVSENEITEDLFDFVFVEMNGKAEIMEKRHFPFDEEHLPEDKREIAYNIFDGREYVEFILPYFNKAWEEFKRENALSHEQIIKLKREEHIEKLRKSNQIKSPPKLEGKIIPFPDR